MFKIKFLWEKLKKRFGKSTISYLMIILLITKFLGFIKLRMIALIFGASKELDIFWAALTIPDMMYNILISGTINAAIIPTFSQTLHKEGGKSLAILLVKLMIVLSILFIFGGVLIFIFAEQLSIFLVSGELVKESFGVSKEIGPGELEMLANLTRLAILNPIILGVSTILGGYLVVYKKFFINSLTPLIYNLVILIFASLLSLKFNFGVYGLAIAILLGTVAQLATQLPTLLKLFKQEGVIFNQDFLRDIDFFNVRKLFDLIKTAAPRIISTIIQQSVSIFNKIIGFSLTTGAISAYNYAFNLHLFPVHIITGAFSQVALSNFTELYNTGRMEELKEAYNRSFQLSMFISIPFVAIMLVLRLPLVRLVYGTGNFDWWDTKFTSWGLALLSFAVIAQIGSSLILRLFYAVEETIIPLFLNILRVGLNLLFLHYLTNFFSHYLEWRHMVSEGKLFSFEQLLSWFATRYSNDYAVGGIAAAFSFSFLIFLILSMIFANSKVKGITTWNDTFYPFFKKLLSFLIMTILMYLVYKWLDNNVLDTTRTINVIIITTLTSIVGGFIYLVSSFILKVKELSYLYLKLGRLLNLNEK